MTITSASSTADEVDSGEVLRRVSVRQHEDLRSGVRDPAGRRPSRRRRSRSPRPPTSNPASRSVAARSARVFVVVFVIRRNGTPSSRRRPNASTAPGSASHDTASTPSMSSSSPSIATIRSVPSQADPERAASALDRAIAFLPSLSLTPLLIRRDEPVPRWKERPHRARSTANVARTWARLAGPNGKPYPWRTSGGKRPEGESSHRLEHRPPLGHQAADRRTARATFRAASVTKSSPERTVSATYASSAAHRRRDHVPGEGAPVRPRASAPRGNVGDPPIVEAADRQPFEQEGALDQARVHPQQQRRVQARRTDVRSRGRRR